MNIRQVAGTVAIGVSALAATAAVAAQHLATAAISASAPANTASVAAQQPAAADRLWSRLDPVSLGGGWKLRANATSPDYYLTSPSTVPVTPAEIISVALDRRLSRRADESHVAALHLAEASVAFDGRDGRWATRDLASDRRVACCREVARGGHDDQGRRQARATRPGRIPPVELPWAVAGAGACDVDGQFRASHGHGDLQNDPMTRLTGTITYNQGGPLECGQPAPKTCEPTTYLSSQYDTLASSSRGINAFLYIDRGRRFLSLQVRDRTGWTHIMALHELDVLSGELPTIRGRLRQTSRSAAPSASPRTRQRSLSRGPAGQRRPRACSPGIGVASFTGWGWEARVPAPRLAPARDIPRQRSPLRRGGTTFGALVGHDAETDGRAEQLAISHEP